jgi:hypothetical protein
VVQETKLRDPSLRQEAMQLANTYTLLLSFGFTLVPLHELFHRGFGAFDTCLVALPLPQFSVVNRSSAGVNDSVCMKDYLAPTAESSDLLVPRKTINETSCRPFDTRKRSPYVLVLCVMSSLFLQGPGILMWFQTPQRCKATPSSSCQNPTSTLQLVIL